MISKKEHEMGEFIIQLIQDIPLRINLTDKISLNVKEELNNDSTDSDILTKGDSDSGSPNSVYEYQGLIFLAIL